MADRTRAAWGERAPRGEGKGAPGRVPGGPEKPPVGQQRDPRSGRASPKRFPYVSRLEGEIRVGRASRPRVRARWRRGRAGGWTPARGGGPCGGGGAVEPPQGLLQRGMSLGLLRCLQEPLRALVHHAGLWR